MKSDWPPFDDEQTVPPPKGLGSAKFDPESLPGVVAMDPQTAQEVQRKLDWMMKNPAGQHVPDSLKFDPVKNPKGYTSRPISAPGEVIDAVEAWDLPYHLGAVVKYVARYRDKGTPVQDLEKARWYLDRYIALLKKRGT